MNKEIKVFNETEINKLLDENLLGWKYDGKWIRKTYKTHSWKSTLMVVNSIGHLAEAAWHHPTCKFRMHLLIKLMNHSMKGITQLDFDLAKIDEFILWNPQDEDHLSKEPHQMLISIF